MTITRQLFRLVLLGAINHQITHICVAGSIFEDTRRRCREVHPRLGQLVSCHLCFGTWVGFLLALVFRPRLAEANGLAAPGPLRQAAAFLADAFAIALAGRFFTELLAILAGRAAVEQRQRDLLETQTEIAREVSG